MADSSVPITPGSGANIDTFTQASGDHRQAIVIGDAANAPTARVGASGALAVRGGQPAGQTFAVTAGTPVTGAALDVSEAGNVTFVIKNTTAGSPFTGSPVIVFEQSDDGTSWAPLPVTNNTTFITSSQPPIAAGTANGEQVFDAALEGINWVRARVTTTQAANGMTIDIQPGGLAFSPAVASIAPPPATSGLTSVTAAVASTTLLAANAARKGGLVFNDSTANLFLGLTAAAVSQTAYTVKIPAGGLFELPWPVWTGQLTGTWDAANGAARITELT